ncbi:ATP-binding sensor histidine kinase [Burkholderia pyrrocinia]|uniref:ATP-binding sensor histidine kinase n=1 Tax=Burkholderia pyrrocinia TaxID=60550 RepID=UPI00064C418D|nr:ATP-binding sensor histidine kinase [Burkholderia pyrrocinia]AKM03972.1 hypothetical protein ABD05_28345 [Burkholderia pyrrocinia]
MQRSFIQLAVIRSDRLIVKRGLSDGGRPVLLVTLPANVPSRSAEARFQNELSLANQLDPDWAAVPIGLTRHENEIALALADPGGDPLAALCAETLDITQRLVLALGVVDAIRRLHGRGITHGGLSPHAILVSVDLRRAWLTDFGIASRVRFMPDSNERMSDCGLAPVWCAPEQRLGSNRYVDHRADLYAFGCWMHGLLIEPLSTSASEAQRWPVASVRSVGVGSISQIQRPLADIVARLLEHEADDRYQSAAGVEADLRCALAALTRGRAIPAFQLGAYDAPPPLNRPRRLYGRDSELHVLNQWAEEVAQRGTTALVCASGAAGSGKSAVVDTFCRIQRENGWLVAAGKFDPHPGVSPYRTLCEMLGRLISREIAERTDLEQLRQAALSAVGGLGALITDAIPEARTLLGDPPPAPDIRADSVRARWHETLARFLHVFALPAHPLVIFLDDIQWADDATLGFVTEMLERSAISFLLLVVVSRDGADDVRDDPQGKLKVEPACAATIHSLRIDALQGNAAAELLGDVLGTNPGETMPLAELLYARTSGNPLFTLQLVRKLVDERIVTRNLVSRRWEWTPEQVNAALGAPNLVALIRSRAGALPQPTSDVLFAMACIGNVAQVDVLARTVDLDEEALHVRLQPAVVAGMIMRRSGDYSFVHDRIREVMHSMQRPSERAEWHLRIATILRAMPNDPALRFDVADHLNRARSLLVSREQRVDAARSNLEAAMCAKASGAHGAAAQYLEAGSGLMHPHDLEVRDPLHVQIVHEAAHCDLLRGALDAAEASITRLHNARLTREQRADVVQLEVTLNMLRSRNEAAAAIALRFLRDDFGISLAQYPGDDAVHAGCEVVFAKLTGRSIESLMNLPDMTDHRMVVAVNVLSSLLLPSFYTSRNLFVLHLAKMVELTLDYGVTANSAHALSSFGVAIGELLGRYHDGYRFGLLARDLVLSRGLLAAKAKTLVGLELVSCWTQPLYVAREIIQQAYEAAHESGEFDIACTVRSILVTNSLAIGVPLDEVRREVEAGRIFGLRAGFRDLAEMMVVQRCFVDAMTGRTVALACFDHETFSEADFESRLKDDGNASLCCMYWIMKGVACYMAGAYAESEDAFVRAEAVAWSLTGFFQLFELRFFRGLTCAALIHDANERGTTDREGIRARREQLQVSIEKLTQWANSCDATFSDKRDLLVAEAARCDGRHFEVLGHYESAVRLSKQNGFVHYEAIALERAATFCLRHGLEGLGQSYADRACSSYRKWGASAKAEQLEMEYAVQDSNARARPDTTNDQHLSDDDVRYLIDTTHAISGEVIVERLMRNLMTSTLAYVDADFGAFLRRGALLETFAIARRDGEAVTVELGLDGPVSASLPLWFIHGVIADCRPLVLDQTAIRQRYASDAYFRSGGIVGALCVPVVKHGQSVGALYLECHRAASALPARKLAVLERMLAQAVISMEVARLYADISEENSERRRIEAMLREKEAALAQAQRISGTANWHWCVESGKVTCSIELLHMLRLESAGKPVTLDRLLEATHPDDRDHVRHVLDDAVRNRRGFRFQFRGLEDEAGSRHFEAVGDIQTRNEESPRYVGTTMDITDREEREQALQVARNELAHVMRVHMLGQLAASIAHEVNQPLSAIIANGTAGLRWLLREEPDLGEVSCALQRIVTEGNRANDVIRGTRSLARGATPHRGLVSLGDLIAETKVLLHRECRNQHVVIEENVAKDLANIVADRVQIQQVLINLMLNAIEALRAITDRRRRIFVDAHAFGTGQIAVVVRDNGPGLGDGDLQRLFEAFYSTKVDGLGMGLSICRSIVEAHGGTLDVAAVDSVGAAFRFVLPAQQISAAEEFGRRTGDPSEMRN